MNNILSFNFELGEIFLLAAKNALTKNAIKAGPLPYNAVAILISSSLR